MKILKQAQTDTKSQNKFNIRKLQATKAKAIGSKQRKQCAKVN